MRNQISDIAVLANLLNLEDLRLSENQISDISPLSGLENIIYLMAANQEIILPETTVGNSVDFLWQIEVKRRDHLLLGKMAVGTMIGILIS